MKNDRRRVAGQRRSEDRELMELKMKIENTNDLAQAAAGRVSTHEAVCAERFAGILHRFDRAEKIVYIGGVMLIGAMGTVIVMLINLLMAK